MRSLWGHLTRNTTNLSNIWNNISSSSHLRVDKCRVVASHHLTWATWRKPFRLCRWRWAIIFSLTLSTRYVLSSGTARRRVGCRNVIICDDKITNCIKTPFYLCSSPTGYKPVSRPGYKHPPPNGCGSPVFGFKVGCVSCPCLQLAMFFSTNNSFTQSVYLNIAKMILPVIFFSSHFQI